MTLESKIQATQQAYTKQACLITASVERDLCCMLVV